MRKRKANSRKASNKNGNNRNNRNGNNKNGNNRNGKGRKEGQGRQAKGDNQAGNQPKKRSEGKLKLKGTAGDTLYLKKPPYCIEHNVFALPVPHAFLSEGQEITIMAKRNDGRYRKAGKFRVHLTSTRIPIPQLGMIQRLAWVAPGRSSPDDIKATWIEERIQPSPLADIASFIRIIGR